MRKSQRIEPVGGDPVFVLSKLLKPEEVKPIQLPEMAGIYFVVAMDGNGNRIKQSDEPTDRPLSGLVYVGMTGSKHTLKGRFPQLARAWRGNSKQKKPSHGSRVHYNNDIKAQRAFAVENVRIAYMPLPTKQPEPPELQKYAASQNMTVEEFRQRTGTFVDVDSYVFASEAKYIQWFKRRYKYLPILNRDDDGGKDAFPTDNFVKQHLVELEKRGL